MMVISEINLLYYTLLRICADLIAFEYEITNLCIAILTTKPQAFLQFLV